MPDDKPVTSTELRAALDAVVEALTLRQDRAVEALTLSQDRAVEAIALRQDRAVETIAGEISSFRAEVKLHFSDVDHRLDRINERLDLLWGGQASINKWADRLDKDQTALGQNYFSQQRAIEALTRRVEALEKKAS